MDNQQTQVSLSLKARLSTRLSGLFVSRLCGRDCGGCYLGSIEPRPKSADGSFCRAGPGSRPESRIAWRLGQLQQADATKSSFIFHA